MQPSSILGETSNVLVEVLPTALDTARYTAFAEDSGAGALVTFAGVTRDTFQGRRVVRLEYEAYVPMARESIILQTQ